jgi:hypothetical protein
VVFSEDTLTEAPRTSPSKSRNERAEPNYGAPGPPGDSKSVMVV